MARFYNPEIGTGGTNGPLIRWSPIFDATGLTFTGTGSTYPTYNSYYARNGHIVSFWIVIDFSTVTNFGTGQYRTRLPFMPISGSMNHFPGWSWVDPSQNPDVSGHIILNIDHLANSDILDMHYLSQAGGAHTPIKEAMLTQGVPVTFTTASNIYINGTYLAAA